LMMDADRMEQCSRTRRAQLDHFVCVASNQLTVCPCCMDRPGGVMPLCGHGVCPECTQRIFETPVRMCPTCRGELDADWLWQVSDLHGAVNEESNAPLGSRAKVLLQILRNAPRCIVWAPTDEIARAACSSVTDYTPCARVTGTAAARSQVLQRLSESTAAPYAVFMTPTTSCGTIPVEELTDIVLYAPMGPRGRACALAYARPFMASRRRARVHEIS
jgi:hypothetical protein